MSSLWTLVHIYLEKDNSTSILITELFEDWSNELTGSAPGESQYESKLIELVNSMTTKSSFVKNVDERLIRSITVVESAFEACHTYHEAVKSTTARLFAALTSSNWKRASFGTIMTGIP